MASQARAAGARATSCPFERICDDRSPAVPKGRARYPRLGRAPPPRRSAPPRLRRRGGRLPRGRIRIGGFGFGVAAVLFAGLAFGMADPQLKVPRSLWTLGLVLFVYTVGLAAGPGFLTALRRRGVGANVAVLVAVDHGRRRDRGDRARGRARRRGDGRRVRGRAHEHARARGVARGAEADRAGAELRRGVGPDPGRLLARLSARSDDRAAGGVRRHAPPPVDGAGGGPRRDRRADGARRARRASARSASCRQRAGTPSRSAGSSAARQLFVAEDDVELVPGDLVTVVGPEPSRRGGRRAARARERRARRARPRRRRLPPHRRLAAARRGPDGRRPRPAGGARRRR